MKNFKIIACLFLLSSLSVMAQETILFKVYGTVYDTDKKPVPNWTVLVETDLGFAEKLQTDRNGFYSVALKFPKSQLGIAKISVADPCSKTPLEQKAKAFEGAEQHDFVICASNTASSDCDIRFSHIVNADGWVEFHAAAPSSAILKYLWTFGDGQSEVGTDVKHQYLKEGVYEVVLIVKGLNCVKEYRFKVEIKNSTNPPPPSKSFSASCCGKINISPSSISTSSSPNTFIFTAGADFRFKEITWDFGDGETLTTTNTQVRHSYKAAGRYLVKAIIKGESCTIELSLWLQTSNVVKPNPCVLDFQHKEDQLTAYFQLVSKSRPDKIEWNFGDGQTSTEINPTHKYDKPGVYLVKVTASIGGQICTSEQKVEIKSGGTNPSVKLEIYDSNPNPAGDDMLVSIRASDKASATMVIGDVNGISLIKVPVELEPGDNRIAVTVKDLKPGTYIIVLYHNAVAVSKWRFQKI